MRLYKASEPQLALKKKKLKRTKWSPKKYVIYVSFFIYAIDTIGHGIF